MTTTRLQMTTQWPQFRCVYECKTPTLTYDPSPGLTAHCWWYNRAAINSLSVALPIHAKTRLLTMLGLSGETPYRENCSLPPKLLATLLAAFHTTPIQSLTARRWLPNVSCQRPHTSLLIICLLLATVQAETTSDPPPQSDKLIAKQRDRMLFCSQYIGNCVDTVWFWK